MNTRAEDPPLLRVARVGAAYAGVPAIRDIDIEVCPGEVVAVLGRNGAGKSTILKAISSLVKITAGQVEFDGRDVTNARPQEIVRAGLQHVAEGHRVFHRQSTRANLELSMQTGRRRRFPDSGLDYALSVFPELEPLLPRNAGSLSGGQQQMLAIAQALVARPKLLALDEPSLGLAPVVLDRVYGAIADLQNSGMTILLVEQAVERALQIARRVVIVQNGTVTFSGPTREVGEEALALAY
jgi:branched-chain amino acid transport system ATP-binding protein